MPSTLRPSYEADTPPSTRPPSSASSSTSSTGPLHPTTSMDSLSTAGLGGDKVVSSNPTDQCYSNFTIRDNSLKISVTTS